MGTKADFYIKDGDDLVWHGSIQWEGNEKHIPKPLLQSSCNEEFLQNLDKFLKSRSDSVVDRWPWHWESSKQTDYVYIMWEEKGAVYISHHNSPCYTIYNYKDYLKRLKTADKEGKEIEDFKSFVKKISPFTPCFPRMIDDRKTRQQDPTSEN